MKESNRFLWGCRHIKAMIWLLRIARWERLEAEATGERKGRLQWKLEGARKKVALYLNKHHIGIDLSGG